jgi:hypothetical protein
MIIICFGNIDDLSFNTSETAFKNCKKFDLPVPFAPISNVNGDK